MSPLRVAFATMYNTANISHWSGTVYFMARALEQQKVDLVRVDKLFEKRLLVGKVVNRGMGLLGIPTAWQGYRTKGMSQRMAARITAKAKSEKCNLILSPSSIPLAMLNGGLPKVFFTDATFKNLLERHGAFSDYPADLIQEGHDLEFAALGACDLAIYSSEWAARSAVEYYGADPAKVKVLPFGSNLMTPITEAEVEKAVKARFRGRCELILIGVDWEGKGGPLAWNVAKELNRMGMPTRLTVVGCQPPTPFNAPFMEVVPFVSKKARAGQQRLSELLLRSHFLLVPSEAECFGIVYAEASSRGVPSLGHDVGGVASAVRRDRNGRLFPLGSGPEPFATYIMELMQHRAAYGQLAMSSYQEYTERLNWGTTGSKLHALLKELP